MRSVGLPIPDKEKEYRRALRPQDVKLMKHPQQLYFESGYGAVMGYSDEDYVKAHAHVTSRKEVLKQQVICDLKIGDGIYLEQLKEKTILFGWVHAAETKERAELIKRKKFEAYAFENMYEAGQHVFYQNNELAGVASVLEALRCFGVLPAGKKAAILGNGNTAHGACRILTQLGAHVDIFTRRMEQQFQNKFMNYDIIVNCILWDVSRKEHILTRSDLSQMHSDAMIIDVSCDAHCAIETVVPRPLHDPCYIVDGIFHYAGDHTPSIYFRTFSEEASGMIAGYLDELIADIPGDTLKKACIAKDGEILDQDIIDYIKRAYS